jgi:predicted ArsR family transcriptional regulator
MRQERTGASTLQEQARALGDPTRFAIFRRIADADGPVDVAALTAAFEFNHNAIRQHLAKLVGAELVVEATAPASGRGRPRKVYVVAPGVDSRWGAVGPYERLSLLLSEMVRTGDGPRTVGRRAGIAEPQRSDDDVEDMVVAMQRAGFDPVARKRKGLEIVLRTCPFATTAAIDPDVVCEMHLGIAEGLAARTGVVVVDDLVRHDPHRANCRLRLSRQ